MMQREFAMVCDYCKTVNDSSEWYAELARESAINDGWHVMGNRAICEDCWDNNGIRWKDI